MAAAALAGWLASSVLTVTAGYCLARARAARRAGDPVGRRADLGQGLMGLAMAAMLCPLATATPRPAWLVVFGVLSLVLLLLAGRAGRAGWRRCCQHLPASLAMLGLLVVASPAAAATARLGTGMAGMPGMPGMTSAGLLPGLALPLLAYFWGHAAWSAARLVGVAGSGPSGAGSSGPGSPGRGPSGTATAALGSGGAPPWALTAPELAVACQVVMGIGMGYMLLTMI